MKQIIVNSPIHVSATGPVFLLSPNSMQLRQARRGLAWQSRRAQTLLLAALAALSLVMLLRSITPAAQLEVLHEVQLSNPRGVDSSKAAADGAMTGAAVSDAAAADKAPSQPSGLRQHTQQRQRQRDRQPEQPQLATQSAAALAAAAEFPLHVCCVGDKCLAGSSKQQRRAVVTYVRSKRQLEQAQALAMSLWATNPGLDLAVMLVQGELPPTASAAALSLNATLVYVDPLVAPGGAAAGAVVESAGHGPAPAATWIKPRAWGLTQYSAVLLVDPSTRFLGDVRLLFDLPTDYAALVAGSSNSSSSSSSTSGTAGGGVRGTTAGSETGSATAVPPGMLGVIPHLQQQQQQLRVAATDAIAGQAVFLRPCAPAESHMALLLAPMQRHQVRPQQGPDRQSAPAAGLPQGLGSETDFLSWYHSPDALASRLPFDVFVINLLSATDRLAAFRRSYGASDLGVKTALCWPAVDGRGLDLAPLVSAKALAQIEAAQALGYRTKHYQLTRGSVGCYLSHVRLWRALLEGHAGGDALQQHLGAERQPQQPEQPVQAQQQPSQRYALIFEDDAVLEPGVLSRLGAARPFPPDWDILLLGYYCWRCSPLSGEWARFIRVEGFFGTHAYLVHTRALRKVFAYRGLLPVGQQIDALLSEMAQRGALSVYALGEHPMLVDQNNKDFRSSVQIPVKRGLWNDPWSRDDDEEDGEEAGDIAAGGADGASDLAAASAATAAVWRR